MTSRTLFKTNNLAKNYQKGRLIYILKGNIEIIGFSKYSTRLTMKKYQRVVHFILSVLMRNISIRFTKINFGGILKKLKSSSNLGFLL